MAGDWIKMRTCLATAPKVVRIASAIKADVSETGVRLRSLVIGSLHAVWSLADEHSTDGALPGYTLEMIDEVVGIDGFGAAMQAAGWIENSPGGLVLRDFDVHNGASAKRRAQDAERKRVRRTSAERPQAERTECGPEKRREEKSSSVPTGRAEPAAPAPPTAEAKPRKPRRQTEAAKATRVAQCIDALQAHPRLAQHAQLARFWPLAMRALAGSGRKLEPEQAETWLALADREPDRAARELELEYAAGMRSLPKLFQGGQAARAPEGAQTVDWRKKAAQAAQGRAS